MEAANSVRKKWVANFFRAKIEEYQYYLSAVVQGCDKSLGRFRSGLDQIPVENRVMIYAYGSLTNMVQTIKDSGSVFIEPAITWSDIKQLRHGEFFYLSRNAATHDGNPIVDLWSDGRFYIGADIERFDDKGRFVSIQRPESDVRTFVLEFSQDFYEFLAERLTPMIGDDRLNGISLTPEIMTRMMESEHVPQFAKDMLEDNLEQIQASISEAKFDPVVDMLASIEVGREYIKGLGWESVD